MSYKTPEKKREGNKKYADEHKKEISERKRQTKHLIKVEVLSYYSGGIPICVRCGIVDIDVLCLDHIEGSGGEWKMKNMRGGNQFYRWIKKQGYPQGLQVLCANCNLKKPIIEKK